MIVVAIRHSANAVARVLDVPKVIDYMVDPSNPLSGSIDPDHVGMSGFSTGGRTSLAVTGGWAAPPNNAPPILADPRIVAMVLYEPGRDNTLEDVATISIPYLVLGGTRSTNAVDVIPELFDTTVLATPRIRVLNPEAIHFNYQTDVCEQIEETREAAWDLPGQQIEPLTNLITLYPNNDPSQPCLKIPGTEICRRVCNTGQQGPAGPPPLVGAAAIHACTFWNQGELMAFNLGFIQGFAFGGGRNICNRIGVDSDQSLDTHPEDEFTDAFLGGDPLIPLFEGNDQFNSNELTPELPLTEEVIVPMVKLYTVAFFKKYLEDDGRYMRYLTPGYANVHNLEAIVMIIGEDEEE
jgi:hypothetical protein